MEKGDLGEFLFQSELCIRKEFRPLLPYVPIDACLDFGIRPPVGII